MGGAEGVRDVFQFLNHELETAMILAGTPNIDAVKNATLFDPEKGFITKSKK